MTVNTTSLCVWVLIRQNKSEHINMGLRAQWTINLENDCSLNCWHHFKKPKKKKKSQLALSQMWILTNFLTVNAKFLYFWLLSWASDNTDKYFFILSSQSIVKENVCSLNWLTVKVISKQIYQKSSGYSSFRCEYLPFFLVFHDSKCNIFAFYYSPVKPNCQNIFDFNNWIQGLIIVNLNSKQSIKRKWLQPHRTPKIFSQS